MGTEHVFDGRKIDVVEWKVDFNTTSSDSYVFQNVTFVWRDLVEPNNEINTAKSNNPTKIIRSGNRTIVFWTDGTKTIVKRADDEEDNLYHAFTAALAEKVYGSNSKVKKILRDKTVVQKTSKDEWKSALERAMNILLCKKGSK